MGGRGNFKKYASNVGFTEIGGEKKQIGIGDIKELDDGTIEVEVLGGCEKDALLDTMHKIAKEHEATVKAAFQDEEIVVNPEDV